MHKICFDVLQNLHLLMLKRRRRRRKNNFVLHMQNQDADNQSTYLIWISRKKKKKSLKIECVLRKIRSIILIRHCFLFAGQIGEYLWISCLNNSNNCSQCHSLKLIRKNNTKKVGFWVAQWEYIKRRKKNQASSTRAFCNLYSVVT